MDRDGFRRYLKGRGVSEDGIEPSLEVAEEFEAFLKRRGRAGSLAKARPQDAAAFIAGLIEGKTNTHDRLIALARYAWFSGNREVYVAVVETIDGAEVLDNLYAKLERELGKKARDEIFDGVALPPLGTPSSEKPPLTQKLLERLERKVGPERCRRLLGDSLRTLPDEGYLAEKEKYEEAGSLDAYLERKGEDFVALLESLEAEKKFFFSQEITDEVIDYVRSHPEVKQGVRKGNVIYEAKIPYMAKEYLAESDPRMKAYYYCHCPWVRESIRTGDAKVPPIFCNCSAGFHKRAYEVIFGRRLRAEVLETVLQGDPWCKFAITLPEGTVTSGLGSSSRSEGKEASG
jgi:hypothetical protein